MEFRADFNICTTITGKFFLYLLLFTGGGGGRESERERERGRADGQTDRQAGRIKTKLQKVILLFSFTVTQHKYSIP